MRSSFLHHLVDKHPVQSIFINITGLTYSHDTESTHYSDREDQ